MNARFHPIVLHHTEWPGLVQSVKEVLVHHLQSRLVQPSVRRLRLVVSLRLIADAHPSCHSHQLDKLVAWLTLQSARIEVTASHLQEHRLYIDMDA